MRFREFIKEEKEEVKDPASLPKTTLEFEGLKKWVFEHAPEYARTNKPMWRGIASETAEGLYNTALLDRKAANTHNFYNVWISNHPAWAEFPKRNKSFVGSSDRFGAFEGMKYVMVPKDTAKIGICPKNDLWRSFYWLNKYQISMSDFMNAVYAIMIHHGVNSPDNLSWERLQYILKKLDVSAIEKAAADPNVRFSEDFERNVMVEIYRNIQTDMFDMFANIFKPDGFKVVLAKDFTGADFSDRHEVWTSGEILLLNENTWLKIIEELK